MPSTNYVLIRGHLGRDPEVRDTSFGMVANFSVATTTRYKDKSGEMQESTEWHNCVAWKEQAEFAQSLQKGNAVEVEGRLKTRKWQDKNGLDRYTTEIHGRVYRLGHYKRPAEQQQPQQQQPQSNMDFDDDIPF